MAVRLAFHFPGASRSDTQTRLALPSVEGLRLPSPRSGGGKVGGKRSKVKVGRMAYEECNSQKTGCQSLDISCVYANLTNTR